MKNIQKLTIAVLLAAGLVAVACGKKADAPTAEAPAAIDGAEVYTTYACNTCHGDKGLGDGAAGAALNPKPRNFTDANWKNGTELATVISTIKNGIEGGGMAPYAGVIPDAEIEAVAKYVLKLGGK